MIRFLLGRAVQGGLVLLVLSLAVYLLIGLMPGDPIDLMVAGDPNLSAADAARLKALYGLDQPLLSRWWGWLGELVQGRLGYSRLYGRPVLELVAERLPLTLLLVGLGLGGALLIAVPLGVLAAAQPPGVLGALIDGLVNLLAYAAAALPVFWSGLLLILLFAVQLGWLPPHAAAAADPALPWGERLAALILPVTVLILATLPSYLRQTRQGVREALDSPYIRLVRAKGAGPVRVVLRHALRNAAIPLATLLALDLGMLVSGAVVTETIFALPGMGRTIYEAIMGSDYNLALVCLLLACAATLIGTVLADLAYAVLDPRIARPGAQAGGRR